MLKTIVLRVMLAALLTASGDALLGGDAVSGSAKKALALIGTVLIAEPVLLFIGGRA
ncbi:MAG: hypothetical protein IKG85_10205 [Clostridia bacterium]|nr:hypothetical protein [Clostridia bacterium]